MRVRDYIETSVKMIKERDAELSMLPSHHASQIDSSELDAALLLAGNEN